MARPEFCSVPGMRLPWPLRFAGLLDSPERWENCAKRKELCPDTRTWARVQPIIAGSMPIFFPRGLGAPLRSPEEPPHMRYLQSHQSRPGRQADPGA